MQSHDCLSDYFDPEETGAERVVLVDDVTEIDVMAWTAARRSTVLDDEPKSVSA